MTPKHQTGLLFVYYITKFEFAGIFILKLKMYIVFRDIVHLPTAHCTE